MRFTCFFSVVIYAKIVWFSSVIGIQAHALPSSSHGLHMQVMTILQ